jgi:uncharacterized phage protein
MDKNKLSVEPKVFVEPEVFVEPAVEEDRSVFNCPDCKGTGLNTIQTQRCVKCNGTGKV